jgi:hypothetical protein
MDSPSPNILEHTFRVEDHAVSVLVNQLKQASIEPQHVGQVAKAVLTIAHQALSRAELQSLLDQLSQEYPELKSVSVQEELYVREEAEKIIKSTIEELIQQDKTDEALQLAKQINQGELPVDLQQRLENI